MDRDQLHPESPKKKFRMQRRYFIEFAEKFLYTYINGVMAKLTVGDIIWSTKQNRKFLIKKEKWWSKNHSWVWSYFQKLSLEHWLFKCKIEGRYNVFVYGVTGRLKTQKNYYFSKVKKKKKNLYTVLTVLLIIHLMYRIYTRNNLSRFINFINKSWEKRRTDRQTDTVLD